MQRRASSLFTRKPFFEGAYKYLYIELVYGFNNNSSSGKNTWISVFTLEMTTAKTGGERTSLGS